jgi:hypothetical protein
LIHAELIAAMMRMRDEMMIQAKISDKVLGELRHFHLLAALRIISPF